VASLTYWAGWLAGRRAGGWVDRQAGWAGWLAELGWAGLDWAGWLICAFFFKYLHFAPIHTNKVASLTYWTGWLANL
jgi:hypothetical protein